VVGINTPLRLYELLGIREEFHTKDTKEEKKNEKMIEQWENAIDLYEQRNFVEAMKLFKSIFEQNPDDKTAELYAERCAKYQANPPPENWDAVNNLTEK